MQEQYRFQIEQLIASATTENNLLAYQLLQSQLGKNKEEAVAYIVNFCLKHPAPNTRSVELFWKGGHVAFGLGHIQELGATCCFTVKFYQHQQLLKDTFYYIKMEDYEAMETAGEDTEAINIGNYVPAQFDVYIQQFCQEYSTFLVEQLEL